MDAPLFLTHHAVRDNVAMPNISHRIGRWVMFQKTGPSMALMTAHSEADNAIADISLVSKYINNSTNYVLRIVIERNTVYKRFFSKESLFFVVILLSGNMKRFSVSLPPSLVKEFDETWQDMDYENRSRAVHDAVRGFISEAKWSKKVAGEMIGAVLVLSYIDKSGLIEAMASLKHKFKEIICSNQQMFVDDNKMLEIISVKGDAMEIKKMIELLKSKKGVKHVTSSIITP